AGRMVYFFPAVKRYLPARYLPAKHSHNAVRLHSRRLPPSCLERGFQCDGSKIMIAAILAINENSRKFVDNTRPPDVNGATVSKRLGKRFLCCPVCRAIGWNLRKHLKISD